MLALRTAALFLAALPLAQAFAAGFEVPVAGSRDLAIAVPDPLGGPPEATATIATVIRKDLDMTGYFQIVDPKAYIERGKGPAPGDFAYSDWRVVGAAGLVKTRLLDLGDPACDATRAKRCLDVWVYDVSGESKLASRRLRTEAGAIRDLAHAAASLALEAMVGELGFFGGRIAAVSSRGGNKELVLVSLDGAEVAPVTRNGAINLSPTWSPDGNQLAWTSFKRGNPDIYVKNLRSGAVRTLSARDGVNISPAFSPDGKTLAIARSDGGDADLFLLDATTGRELRRLTVGGGIDVSPSWSPDGTKLAFSSERSGGSTIYVIDVNTGEASRLTRYDGFFTDPAWSPDGSRIAFVARKGNFDVFTVRSDGSDLRRITQDAGDNEDPSWSPDGRYLTFSSTRRGRSEIWVSTYDGRHQVPITSTGGWSQPSWRPEAP